MSSSWSKTRMPSGDDDLLWEIFHENSKTASYSPPMSPEEIIKEMQDIYQSLPYDGYHKIELPPPASLQSTLGEAIFTRTTVRNMKPHFVPMEKLAALLYYSYGVTRKNDALQRPFRVVPSGGALYPLEIYFHASNIENLPKGVYHYNPLQNQLSELRVGDYTSRLAEALIQPKLAECGSLLVLITAVFNRSIFKYGDRGYRFAFLEAGHVGQNLALVASALGLACSHIGGYFDRQIDELLGLDGVTHSAIYLVAIGIPVEDSTDTADLEVL